MEGLERRKRLGRGETGQRQEREREREKGDGDLKTEIRESQRKNWTETKKDWERKWYAGGGAAEGRGAREETKEEREIRARDCWRQKVRLERGNQE